MNRKNQAGYSLSLPIILIALALMAYAYALYEKDAKESRIAAWKATPDAYSAEYAVAVKEGFAAKIDPITPGLYKLKYAAPGENAYLSIVMLLNQDGSFQKDLRIHRGADETVMKGVLQGRYKQVGAVLEFSDLVGDLALVPQQKKVLLTVVQPTSFKVRPVGTTDYGSYLLDGANLAIAKPANERK